MKSKLTWSAQAREDLIEIYVTIAMDKPSAAERTFKTIQRRIEMLAMHPRMGVRRPDIARSARVLTHGSYLVLYETHPDTDEGTIHDIEIVRIVHGMRDLADVF
jgi:toxin ParE1/3/4